MLFGVVSVQICRVHALRRRNISILIAIVNAMLTRRVLYMATDVVNSKVNSVSRVVMKTLLFVVRWRNVVFVFAWWKDLGAMRH